LPYLAHAALADLGGYAIVGDLWMRSGRWGIRAVFGGLARGLHEGFSLRNELVGSNV
jgi:RsiW-degrading membrane proteinase PrsW (M82 family)